MHRYSLLTGGSVHLSACVRDASVQLAYGRFGASGSSVRVALCIVHLTYLTFGEVCPQEANNSTTYVYINIFIIDVYVCISIAPPFCDHGQGGDGVIPHQHIRRKPSARSPGVKPHMRT